MLIVTRGMSTDAVPLGRPDEIVNNLARNNRRPIRMQGLGRWLSPPWVEVAIVSLIGFPGLAEVHPTVWVAVC